MVAQDLDAGVPSSDVFHPPASPLHVLFVCSKNQWRSPTAECLYRDQLGLAVRSAGTSRSARRIVSRRDLEWADLVVAMEHKHVDRLRAAFREELQRCDVRVLGIEDRHRYMDPELVREIRAAVNPILAELTRETPDDSAGGNDRPGGTV